MYGQFQSYGHHAAPQAPAGVKTDLRGTDWIELRTAEGQTYYQNRVTGLTSWTIPVEQKPAPPAAPAVVAPPPPGTKQWEELTDSQGKVYYHNKFTGETTWKRPFKNKGNRKEARAAKMMAAVAGEEGEAVEPGEASKPEHDSEVPKMGTEDWQAELHQNMSASASRQKRGLGHADTDRERERRKDQQRQRDRRRSRSREDDRRRRRSRSRSRDRGTRRRERSRSRSRGRGERASKKKVDENDPGDLDSYSPCDDGSGWYVRPDQEWLYHPSSKTHYQCKTGVYAVMDLKLNAIVPSSDILKTLESPGEWKMCKAVSGRKYWRDTSTNATAWKKPGATQQQAQPAQLQPQAHQQHAVAAAQELKPVVAELVGVSPDPNLLPTGWLEVLSSTRVGEMSYIYQPTGLKQRKRPTMEQHTKMIEQLASKPNATSTTQSVDLPKPSTVPKAATLVKPIAVGTKKVGGGWISVGGAAGEQAGDQGGDAQGGWNVVTTAQEPQVWLEYKVEQGQEIACHPVGSFYYKNIVSKEVSWSKPRGFNDTVRVVPHAEVEHRRMMRLDLRERSKWGRSLWSYDTRKKKELAELRKQLLILETKSEMDPSSVDLRRQVRKAQAKLDKCIEKATTQDALAAQVEKNDGELPRKEEEGGDMEENWNELWDEREEAEETRSANMAERFFQNYEKVTGSHGDAIKGLEAEFAGWEKFTKGIGTKLLTSMGYVAGTGLGPKADGLQEPIQALRFKHGVGLDLIRSAKVKNVVKQEHEAHLAQREAKQAAKAAEAEKKRGPHEAWREAFDLMNDITTGSTLPPTLANLNKSTRGDAVLLKSSTEGANGEAAAAEGAGAAPVVEPDKKAEEVSQLSNTVGQNRSKISFLKRRMKDAEKSYERNRLTDPYIAQQALAIIEQSRMELQQAEGALGGAEQKAARQAVKKKKFKF